MPAVRSPLRTGFQLAFAAAYLAIVIASLIPSKALPSLDISDKLEHFAGYMLLAVLGLLAFPGRWKALAVALVATGVGLEILQGVMGLRRQAELLDAVANTVGVAAGVGVVSLLRRSRAVR